MSFFVLICQGIGAIYIRRKPRVRVEAIQSGGGQVRFSIFVSVFNGSRNVEFEAELCRQR